MTDTAIHCWTLEDHAQLPTDTVIANRGSRYIFLHKPHRHWNSNFPVASLGKLSTVSSSTPQICSVERQAHLVLGGCSGLLLGLVGMGARASILGGASTNVSKALLIHNVDTHSNALSTVLACCLLFISL